MMTCAGSTWRDGSGGIGAGGYSGFELRNGPSCYDAPREPAHVTESALQPAMGAPFALQTPVLGGDKVTHGVFAGCTACLCHWTGTRPHICTPQHLTLLRSNPRTAGLRRKEARPSQPMAISVCAGSMRRDRMMVVASATAGIAASSYAMGPPVTAHRANPRNGAGVCTVSAPTIGTGRAARNVGVVASAPTIGTGRNARNVGAVVSAPTIG